MNSLASEVSYRLTSNSILTSNLYVFSYLVPSGADTPPVHAGRYGQQACGMHPTGMHTC